VNTVLTVELWDLREKLIQTIITGEDIKADNLVDNDFLLDAKKLMLRFVRQGTPLMGTHYLLNDSDDPTLQAFKEAGLTNAEDDRVKVIQYPVYLDGNDSLLGLKYYEAIQACHLGVFPSYYEPWGYTPLESAALGVPALTTDLAGFGRFIQKKIKELNLDDNGGIYILDRYQKSDEQVVNAFAEILYKYAQLRRNERVEQKMQAKELSEHADWKVLIKNYVEAHNQALNR